MFSKNVLSCIISNAYYYSYKIILLAQTCVSELQCSVWVLVMSLQFHTF
jgi:hypothetical protein